MAPVEPPRPGRALPASLLALGSVLAVAVLAAGVALVRGDLPVADPAGSPSSSSSDTVAAPSRTVDEEAERLAALDELLAERAAALLDRDREAWLQHRRRGVG